MNRKSSPETSSNKRPLVDPPAGPPGAEPWSVGETPIDTGTDPETAKKSDPTDPAEPADRTSGKLALQVSRLSPPILLALVALSLGLIVLLLVLGGLS